MATDVGGSRSSAGYAFVALLAGAAVAVALGVYGREHTPTGEAIVTFGFGGLASMKVWLSVIVAVLGAVQLTTALWMYGYLGLSAPNGVGVVHRSSGALAVLVSLPVAYHCLWSLGFQSGSFRVLAHSVLGCTFYGAFVTKMLIVRDDSAPARALPIAGGVLFAVLVLLWYTSALWFIRHNGGFPPF